MIEWKTGIVQRNWNGEEPGDEGVQEVEVLLQDGVSARAVHYTDTFPPLSAGDRVLLNTTAVSLKLGTGGVHFVHTVLSRALMRDTDAETNGVMYTAEFRSESNKNRAASAFSGRKHSSDGHMMKLRYTSLQRAVLAAEEPASPYHSLFRCEPQVLGGMPVLVGELHSMLPAALCFLKQQERLDGRQLRIAYIMSDGGALPISFSKHAAVIRKLGWLAGTITYGHAFGGDIETINKYTALLAAKHILKADIAIAAMGPGCAGTGTRFGFSGAETGEIINAVHALKGLPVIIPRISFADSRERHYGISHHTLTVLQEIAQPGVVTALPELEGESGVLLRRQAELAGLAAKHKLVWHTVSPAGIQAQAFEPYPEPVTSMGRGLYADPAFFAGVEASVLAAKSCLAEHRK